MHLICSGAPFSLVEALADMDADIKGTISEGLREKTASSSDKETWIILHAPPPQRDRTVFALAPEWGFCCAALRRKRLTQVTNTHQFHNSRTDHRQPLWERLRTKTRIWVVGVISLNRTYNIDQVL
jgi:hypothetical protein